MRHALLAALLTATAGLAQASNTIAWTDWTSTGPATAAGTIAAPGGSIGVSYSGAYFFVQTGCGAAYWSPGTYNGVYNKPFACDIVALSQGGTRTISFDQPVEDPYLALTSWNSNVADFGTPIEVVAVGSGYWGSGSFVLNGAGTGFTGVGEAHGIIRLPGVFTSITFTHSTEQWHGFTVGVLDVAPIPEPAGWAMLLAGLGVVGGVAGRARRAANSATG
jgi:hypothetical protein